MSNERNPETAAAANAELKQLMANAVALCVACATAAETANHANNPAWAEVVQAFDECTDILRDVEQNL